MVVRGYHFDRRLVVGRPALKKMKIDLTYKIRRKKSVHEVLRLHRSVGSNFGSDRSAKKTQICAVRGGLLDGKITTSRCLIAFFSAVFLAVIRLLSSYFASLAKY
jgi:hypothetical protein